MHVPVADLFAAPTIEGLARKISTTKTIGGSPSPALAGVGSRSHKVIPYSHALLLITSSAHERFINPLTQ
jgi:hypothetical protein